MFRVHTVSELGYQGRNSFLEGTDMERRFWPSKNIARDKDLSTKD